MPSPTPAHARPVSAAATTAPAASRNAAHRRDMNRRGVRAVRRWLPWRPATRRAVSGRTGWRRSGRSMPGGSGRCAAGSLPNRIGAAGPLARTAAASSVALGRRAASSTSAADSTRGQRTCPGIGAQRGNAGQRQVAHVVGRPTRWIATVEQSGHAGVGQHRATVVAQQYGRRRHPAVHEPARVDCGQCLRERHSERDDFGVLQRPPLRQHPVETDARHVVVHQDHRALNRQHAAQPHEVRVLHVDQPAPRPGGPGRDSRGRRRWRGGAAPPVARWPGRGPPTAHRPSRGPAGGRRRSPAP